MPDAGVTAGRRRSGHDSACHRDNQGVRPWA